MKFVFELNKNKNTFKEFKILKNLFLNIFIYIFIFVKNINFFFAIIIKFPNNFK